MSTNEWLAGALEALSGIEAKAREGEPEEAAALAGEFVGALAALVAELNLRVMADPGGNWSNPASAIFPAVAMRRTDWPVIYSTLDGELGSFTAREVIERLFAARGTDAVAPPFKLNIRGGAGKRGGRDGFNAIVANHFEALWNERAAGGNSLPKLPSTRATQAQRDKALLAWRNAISDRIVLMGLFNYRLNLMSVSAVDELPGSGKSLVIVALVSDNLRVRIFDSKEEKVIDKPEGELGSGVDLDQLKKLVKQFLLPIPSALSNGEKSKIVDMATSIAGCDREMYPVFAGKLSNSREPVKKKRGYDPDKRPGTVRATLNTAISKALKALIINNPSND